MTYVPSVSDLKIFRSFDLRCQKKEFLFKKQSLPGNDLEGQVQGQIKGRRWILR